MNTTENPNPQSGTPRRSSKKMWLILIAGMIVYGTILLVMSSGHFTTTQIWFVVQLLNALGFFIALTAFVRTLKGN